MILFTKNQWERAIVLLQRVELGPVIEENVLMTGFVYPRGRREKSALRQMLIAHKLKNRDLLHKLQRAGYVQNQETRAKDGGRIHRRVWSLTGKPYPID